jgi:dTDP-4-dehydrorhamnose reductase
MTWLVVGASGQLGKSVCQALKSRNFEYLAPASRKLNLASKESIDKYVLTHVPRVIVNCAGWTDVDSAEDVNNFLKVLEINGDSIEHLVKASQEVKAIFIHISTDYVFAGIGKIPWGENSPVLPVNAYGVSKAKGESFLHASGFGNTYLFRTAWLYSAYGKNFVKTMVKLALKDEADISVVTDQVGQPTFAGDLAEQIVDSIVKKIPFGIYHGTNSGQASRFEFAQEIFRSAGADIARVKSVDSDAFPRKAKRPAYSVLGHDTWIDSGIDEMRDWKIALADAMPAIISAVKAEG